MVNIKELNPQYITDDEGKKKSVILNIKDFEELIEDIEDLAIIAERKNEPTISHDTVIKDLKNNGLL
ncbi:MAG: hypothetical protein OEZ13_13335 [Spirochaetia bacterium]|nr:hypothetical protein [Spirochaetia bacterium]